MSDKIETYYELFVEEVEGKRYVYIDSELKLHPWSDRRSQLDPMHKTAEEIELVPGGTEALQAWLSGDLRPTEAGYDAVRLEIELESFPDQAEAIRRMTPAELWDFKEARWQEEAGPVSREQVELGIGPRPAEKTLV